MVQAVKVLHNLPKTSSYYDQANLYCQNYEEKLKHLNVLSIDTANRYIQSNCSAFTYSIFGLHAEI